MEKKEGLCSLRSEKVDKMIQKKQATILENKHRKLITLGLFEKEYVENVDNFTKMNLESETVVGHSVDENGRYAFISRLGSSYDDAEHVKEGKKFLVKYVEEVSDEDYELLVEKKPSKIAEVLKVVAIIFYVFSVISFIGVLSIGSGYFPFEQKITAAITTSLGMAFNGLIIHAMSVIVGRLISIDAKLDEIIKK